MEKTKINDLKISCLLDGGPGAWGLRGDPCLWDEIRLKSKNIALPNNEEVLKNILFDLFKEITGHEIEPDNNIFIDRYYHGHGISGGVVSCDWWLDVGIPLILENYKKLIG
jgi:hypothetical protein